MKNGWNTVMKITYILLRISKIFYKKFNLKIFQKYLLTFIVNKNNNYNYL